MQALPAPNDMEPKELSSLDVDSDNKRSRLNVIAGALLGIAMLLLLRRYNGIDHDATLYLGQAMQQHWPGIYGQDLFFAHGSQGSYTLLPWLLGQTFGWISPQVLFLAGGLAGLLLFAAAGWYCVSALLPRAQGYWAWLGVLCLPAMYGRTVIFSYSEPFLTPRPLAEAFCLLAVGLLARGRSKLAATALLGAFACHPLQAIGASLIIWTWAVLQDKRWLHALWLAIPLGLLGFTSLKPFSDLFREIDPAWLAELRRSNGQLFLTGWPVSDYLIVGFDAFILMLAWRSLDGRFAQWSLAALAGLVLGLTASYLLVDALHLVLPAQLQLWRAHWLAHWVAMAALAALLFRDVKASQPSSALCLSLTALLAWVLAGSWVWIPFALLYAFWPRFAGRVQPRLLRLIGALFATGLLLMLVTHIANEFLAFRLAGHRFDLYPLDRRLLMFPLLALGLPLLGLYVWNRAGRKGRFILIAGILCPFIVIAAYKWDSRTLHKLAFESNAFRTDVFGADIPMSSLVYWDSASLVGTWLVLKRADYYDPQQLSGMVFNRGTIFDARLRLRRIGHLIDESIACQDPELPDSERERCRISDESMRQACVPGPILQPDYLVLPYQQSQRSIGHWTMDDQTGRDPERTYWLYSCTQVIDDLQRSPSNQSAD